ncbi:cytidine and dCMP deaminase domain-containing protein 1-like [Dendronephthya gigantea]|uniref:cytidine and dCMP deaminase domain-containing protein 1-like n=1 Tax=Dendronephthya gigantea TaxID=151771 RepID=UPI00106A8669|nr:cytidine and dCMP deaminase domain-containing protein 1-like [Dendronephthya gigantea]
MESNQEANETQQNHEQATGSSNQEGKSHAKNLPRISKDNLYMIIALWMEDFEEKAPEHHKQVGAVLVSPNDVIFAADCSRDDVHAAARLLIKHRGKTEGCKMFMSRKPCPHCARLLVQSKVKRVLFLPTREPEYYLDSNEKKEIECNKEQMRQVDTLFTASSIAQTKFVLQVEDPVIAEARKSLKGNEETCTKELIEKYSAFKDNSKWIKRMKNDLPWPELDDDMIKEIQEYFKKVKEWIAVVLVQSGERERKLYNAKTNGPPDHTKHDQRFMEIARFLAQRTDDPERGVGAVIVSQENEILSFGWNGFPFKAHYGEFPRASSKVKDTRKENPPEQDTPDKSPPEKDTPDKNPPEKDTSNKNPPEQDTSNRKYPYIIHAEQNALLMLNTKNLKDAVLYVTKSPCDECAPLIAMEGIKKMFVDGKVERKERRLERHELGHKLGYNWFIDKVDDDTFTCFKNMQ